jgi:hypothetical protein
MFANVINHFMCVWERERKREKQRHRDRDRDSKREGRQTDRDTEIRKLYIQDFGPFPSEV